MMMHLSLLLLPLTLFASSVECASEKKNSEVFEMRQSDNRGVFGSISDIFGLEEKAKKTKLRGRSKVRFFNTFIIIFCINGYFFTHIPV